MREKMLKAIEDFFKLKELNTNIRTEIMAGLTTFMIEKKLANICK